MVVLTQKSLCNIIPSINKLKEVIKKIDKNAASNLIAYLKNTANRKARTIVDKTSTIAMLKILIECTPFPGSPRAFAYLHKPLLIFILTNIII